MGNSINTLQSTLRNGRLEFKVQTDDFGPNNKATVRVFDKKGFYKDVPLKFERKVDSDDVFVGSLDVASLPRGVKPEQLGMTTFVSTDNQVLWEGKDTPIQSNLIDNQIDSPALVAPTRTLTKRTTSVETESGKLELTWRTQERQGYKSAYGEEYLTDIKFIPNGRGPLDKNASELKVLVTPSVEVNDRGPGRENFVVKTLEDDNKQNFVTVRRQADGTFTAAAEQGKSFVDVPESSIYMGGRTDLGSVQVALADRAGNWDSRRGENYRMDLLRERWPTEIESFINGVSAKTVSACVDKLNPSFSAALATGDLSKVSAAYQSLAAEYPTAIKIPEVQNAFIDRLSAAYNNQQVSPAMVSLVLDQVKPASGYALRQFVETIGGSGNVPVARAVADWAKTNNRASELDYLLTSAARNDASAPVVSALVRDYGLPTSSIDEALVISAHGNSVASLNEFLSSGKTTPSKRGEALGMAAFLGFTGYVTRMLEAGQVPQAGLNSALQSALRSQGPNMAQIVAQLVNAGAQ